MDGEPFTQGMRRQLTFIVLIVDDPLFVPIDNLISHSREVFPQQIVSIQKRETRGLHRFSRELTRLAVVLWATRLWATRH